MKANFKIKDEKSDEEQNSDKNEKQAYENHLKSIPKGWNLWSLRSSKNKIND